MPKPTTHQELLRLIDQAAAEQWEELDLSGMGLAELPKEIGRLTGLKRLVLGKFDEKELNWIGNNFKEIPSIVLKLTQLESLEIAKNQISAIPESIGQLTNLTRLDLSLNQISAIPESIGQLTNLTQLVLHNNQISAIPESIGQLTNLTQLVLSLNQISAIPESIGQLTHLTQLHLSYNQISAIPESIGQLTNLQKLDLRENPISEIIPSEILSSGTSNSWETPDARPILDYYFRTQQPTAKTLYEAKLFIVGEGEVGKTTLAKKLLDPNYKLPPNNIDNTTHGIDIFPWHFTRNHIDYRINIWDFGGQAIYHQTHQFFLTERALYILVADERKQNTDHIYWLDIIRLLGNNSPVLLLQNEKGDRKSSLNLSDLLAEFDNLINPAIGLNLADNSKLPAATTSIQQQLETLLGQGIRYDEEWLNIRQALESDKRNHISLSEYETLCEKNGITDREKRLNLSRFLHNLGVCLHFQDHPLLRQRIILKPNWATTAVYKILDNDRIKNTTHGYFTTADLDQLWHEPAYAELCHELLDLLLTFKVAYEIPRRPGHYIAPHLLLDDTPSYHWQPDPNDLTLRYRYRRFMPKGILTRFIVEQHRKIENVSSPDCAIVWKTGVVLQQGDTRAEVIERYTDREIVLRFCGPRQRDFLTLLKECLDDIHDEFNRSGKRATHQALDYEILIPCNCQTCKPAPKPHNYSIETLQRAIEKRIPTVQCQLSFDDVEPRSLLDNSIAPSRDRRDDFYGREYDDVVDIAKRLASRPIIQNNEVKNMPDQSQKINNFNGPMSGVIGSDNAQVEGNTFTQINNANTAELLAILTSMRQIAPNFPEDIREEIVIDLDDLEAELQKPEDQRNPKRLKRSLIALFTAATMIASPIAGITDFTNNALDIATKLHIELPQLPGK